MNQSEITINKIAQDKIAFDEGLAWFDALAPNLHKKVIQNLVYFIHQAHPDKDAINEGLENAPIKKTMTPIVLMRTNENLKVAMDKIALLPDSETRKSFITLMSVFKVADAKRRETWCKNGCTHEWHNLNTLIIPTAFPMTQNPVLIFRPKNNKMLKVFFIAIVFVVVGIGLVYSGKNIEGWVGIIIFGLMSVASLISFLPGSTYLRLTEKGVEIRSMYRSWFIDWNEIRQFGYGSIKGAEMIVYELNPDSPKKGKAWTKINSSLAGADGGFDTLGHSAEEMVNVLNEWKEKYAGKRHNK